jgi:tetratricopeptide (TPR) repeat protein
MLKHFLGGLDILEQTGSADSVFQFVEQIDKQTDRESTFTMLAKYFARQGRLDQASRFTAAISDDLVSVRCLQEVARELRRKGNLEAGRTILQNAYEKSTKIKAANLNAPHLFLALGREFHDYGRVEEAVALLQRAIDLATSASTIGDSKFLYGCSIQLAKWNRPDEAKLLAGKIQHDWFRKHALADLEKESS